MRIGRHGWKVSTTVVRVCGRRECLFWLDPSDDPGLYPQSPGGCAAEDGRPGCPRRRERPDGILVTGFTHEEKHGYSA